MSSQLQLDPSLFTHLAGHGLGGYRMMTPLGIELRIGQKWVEVDPCFHRVVEVVTWNAITEKVRIKSIRKSWAAIYRFNGKRGGYKPL